MVKQSKAERDAEAEREEREDQARADAMKADAIIQFRRAADMSEERKMAIAEWMREKANQLLAEGHEYAACFTARYRPDEGSEEETA